LFLATESKTRRAPVFERQLVDQTVFEDSELTLKCRVSGDPEPELTWYRNGQQLKTSPSMKIFFTQDNWCLLTIFAAKPSDSGQYICSAYNELGSKSTQCNVEVSGGVASFSRRFSYLKN